MILWLFLSLGHGILSASSLAEISWRLSASILPSVFSYYIKLNHYSLWFEDNVGCEPGTTWINLLSLMILSKCRENPRDAGGNQGVQMVLVKVVTSPANWTVPRVVVHNRTSHELGSFQWHHPQQPPNVPLCMHCTYQKLKFQVNILKHFAANDSILNLLKIREADFHWGYIHPKPPSKVSPKLLQMPLLCFFS